MDSIIIKRGSEKKISMLYPWIFYDQISNESSIITAQSGEIFDVQDYRGNILGFAYLDKESKIAARIISFDKHFKKADTIFFERKISDVLKLREKAFTMPYYRLVNSEGDWLPGLVIDRFDNVFSCQFNNPGILAFKEIVLEAMQNLFQPKGLVVRSPVQANPEVIGDFINPLLVYENNLKFEADLINGQKTGWYYDQRNNRKEIAKYCTKKKVLDVFSYNGAFGIYAAANGANEITIIDSSELAMELSVTNIKLNDLNCKFSLIQNDAFKALEELAREKEKYDIVILDPPPFIRRRENKASGLKGYAKLASLAARVIIKNGIICFASCSHYMSLGALINITKDSFKTEGFTLNVLHTSSHAEDHPICKALPESHYLNAFIAKTI